jgi:subtilisin family serine protease
MMLKLRLGESPDHVPARADVLNRSAAPATTLDGGVIDRLIRQHANGAHITRVHAAAASLGKPGEQHTGYNDQEIVCGLAGTFRLQMDHGSPIEQLSRLLNEVSTVEYASPNYVSGLPFAGPAEAPLAIDIEQAWATRVLMFARQALAYEPGDSGVVVGLVDSGVAPHHPETHRRFRAGYDSVQLGDGDVATGVTLLGDVTKVDNKPVDEYVGHGMGCAGIMVGRGVAIPPGLAGECSLVPIRVLGAAKLPAKQNPVGLGSICDIDMGMKMAVELGAKLINMSFGTADNTLDPMSPKPHADVVRYALMRGCVLVAASGNSGKEEVYWPAAHEGVIAVGSVGLEGKPSTFSTRGEHVALCASGEKVATCGLTGYQLATGTSFAAPFVTAVAALLVSRAQRRSYAVTSGQVRTILLETAQPWASKDTKGYGRGILDAAAALKALDREIDGSPQTGGEPGAPDVTQE